jgi:putative aldouronate transport system permease protein
MRTDIRNYSVKKEFKKSTIFKKHIYPYYRYRELFILFIPVICFFLIFRYLPMYGIVIAFKDYNLKKGIFACPWNGFEHFKLLFQGRSFWQVFRNTFIISFLKLIFGFPGPILFALLLNELRNLKVKKVVQTISYLPHFLSWIVLAGIFIQFLSPSMGPINVLFNSVGLKSIYFLGDYRYFRFTLVVTAIWKSLGWGSIIYLASIAGINPELYEAATIDGAGRLRQTTSITIPSLMPVITIMFILAVGRIIFDDFDQIFNLYNPAVYSTGDVLSTYTYRLGLIQMRYDFAAAVGLFKNVIGFSLIIATNTFVRRFSEYTLW